MKALVKAKPEPGIWLQEVPESTTAVVWNTWAELHPRTAEAMGLKRGDAIRIGREAAEISIPALITEQVFAWPGMGRL